MEHVLARIDTTGGWSTRTQPFCECCLLLVQAAGKASSVTDRAASWVSYLRKDILAGVRKGQHDGSINGELDAAGTAHAIVVEGVGSAFFWTVDPAEDFQRRLNEWRARTVKALSP